MGKLDAWLGRSQTAAAREAEAMEDWRVVRATLEGRRDSYALLVERYQRILHRFVQQQIGDPHAADEIVQMTFVQAYVNLARFRAEASFKTWLHRIALNLCHDRGRAERRRADISPQEALERTAQGQPRLEDLVLGGTIERRIAGLPERQRSVLNLRIWSDLSFKEIARLLGTSENSAKVNYHHAIRKLRQWLREEQS
jgi:RNA polymerase sigma-70 factor (ECF subfamily)